MFSQALIAVLFIFLFALAGAEPTDINFDWKFAKGSHREAVRSDFDDSSWETVDLPHDWAISGPFGELTANGDTGKLPWKGEGWYRKTFTLPAEGEGKRLQFLFDGIMASPTVYLNGQKVGSWIYGYNSFHVDATKPAKWGATNVLTIHVDTHEHTSRWYPGAGIYRKITMRIVDDVHLPYWGTSITTPEITANKASVVLKGEIRNSGGNDEACEVNITIRDEKGDPVAKESQSVTVPANDLGTFGVALEISDPVLWDVDSPVLYEAVVSLNAGGKPVQTETTAFGVRTFKFTADDGFHLNGRRLQMYGVNLHHDHGPLGAAFFPRAMERQLEIMRDMGVNAIRTSHNAPAPELLELCDEMGFVVMNELYDKYSFGAGVRCSGDEYVSTYAEREIANFIRRDRNHPCVVTWSIGNEIGKLTKKQVDRMAELFRKYDSTRPLSIGSHIPGQAPMFKSLDLSGWNYNQKYLNSRKVNPDQPLVYSETASAFGTRGHYLNELPSNKLDYRDDGQLTAHMLTAAPWSDIPELEFERIKKHRYLAGEFVWTGFDYLGEPTPYNGRSAKEKMKKTPEGHIARSSYFGIVDLAGFPKDSYYLYRSHWLPEEPTLHLAPHWNWQGMEGRKLPVIVYTDADEAELFLNGKSLGKRRKGASGTLNLAYGKTASASSQQTRQDDIGNVLEENLAQNAFDGNKETRWCAANERVPQHLQVDLGTEAGISFLRIVWEGKAKLYDEHVEVSHDGESWRPLPNPKSRLNGRIQELIFNPVQARYVRLDIRGTRQSSWASVAELEVYENPQAYENPYYDVVDDYRLRWKGVEYVPGELKAVAYKNGKMTGEVKVETSGEAAALRLTPDRTELQADGFDLCYVTVEAVDKEGRLNPLAMDDLLFAVEGPATLAGVANGNPMGHDSFTDATHPLFYGKATAVLRTKRQQGEIVLSVSNAKLGTVKARVRAR